MTTTTYDLAFSVGKSDKLGGFYPRLINVNIQAVQLCVFEPVAGRLFVFGKSEGEGDYQFISHGKPTPEFVTALKDQAEEACPQKSRVAVEEFGINVAYEENLKAHLEPVVIIEQSPIKVFKYLHYDQEENRHCYSIQFQNGWSFELRVRSVRDDIAMMAIDHLENCVVIDSVIYPIFGTYPIGMIEAEDAPGLAALKSLFDVYCLNVKRINLDKIEERQTKEAMLLR